MNAPLRILVVEDDPQLMTYLCSLFTDWGYRCTAAASAVEALARVERECPDVVLSDLVMPRMSGVDLLKALKAKDCGRGLDCVPIYFILVTGKGTVSSAVRAIMEGADEVLLKPLDEVALREMLARVQASRMGPLA